MKSQWISPTEWSRRQCDINTRRVSPATHIKTQKQIDEAHARAELEYRRDLKRAND